MTDQPAWICPICGPTLIDHDKDGPFCIRHGTQEDIDADPDYERWHSNPPGGPGVRLTGTKTRGGEP